MITTNIKQETPEMQVFRYVAKLSPNPDQTKKNLQGAFQTFAEAKKYF